MNYLMSLFGPVCVLSAIQIIMCQTIDFPSENHKGPYGPIQPKFPTPDCMGFPGSPPWNKCWAKFHGDMANFQHAMEEYAEKVKKQSSKPNATSGNYYSNSYSSFSNSGGSGFSSTSTLSTNGYYIQAKGISISSQSSNNVVEMIFSAGSPITQFESKVEGKELEFKMMTERDQKISVSIRVPQKVKAEQLKIERRPDSIYVTGPSGSDNGNYYSSSNSFSGSGSAPPPNFKMPPMPIMPQFPNFPMNFPFGNNMWMF